MSGDYLCNLIIPGAAKSGTSALHEYLAAHSLISMSSSKEPHHFSRDEHYGRGAQKHNDLFELKSGLRYFGESSTSYMPWPEAAQRVARDLDNPKVIIILRHPVDRSFSHYRWRYRMGLEKRNFLDAMKQDGFGYHPDRPDKFGYMAYLEFSQYAHQCPIWVDAVGEGNCLFLSTDALMNDTARTMASCFAFLGLPPLSLANVSMKVNETSKIGRRTPKLLQKLVRPLPLVLKSSRVFKILRDRLLTTMAPTPPVVMTDEERVFAENALCEDIAWFESRFGQDTFID